MNKTELLKELQGVYTEAQATVDKYLVDVDYQYEEIDRIEEACYEVFLEMCEARYGVDHGIEHEDLYEDAAQ